MRYFWDDKTLYKASEKLAKLINSTKDEVEKAQLRTYYDALNNFYYAYYCGITENVSLSNQRRMISIGNDFTGYSRYYSIVQNFYKSGQDIEDRLYKWDSIVDNAILKGKIEPIKSKKISHERTISLVKSFYESFDYELFEHFMKIYNDRYTSFHFSDPIGYMGSFANSSGDCLFVGGINKNFINVQNSFGSKKVTDTIHECGHGISNFINPLASVDETENFFCEVESIFPELVALFTNYGDFDSLESAVNNYDCLTTYYSCAKNLTLHECLFSAWEDNEYKVDKNFFDSISSKYKISKKSFKSILETSITFDGLYVLSYATALELYHIYKSNKKEALELYKEIIRIPVGVNRLGVVNSLLKIGSHSKECFEEVEENLKLALQKRGLKI